MAHDRMTILNSTGMTRDQANGVLDADGRCEKAKQRAREDYVRALARADEQYVLELVKLGLDPQDVAHLLVVREDGGYERPIK